MRTILGLLCLFVGGPAQAASEEPCPSKVEQVRAVLSEIASDGDTARDPRAHDLPEGLREAVEAWTAHRISG